MKKRTFGLLGVVLAACSSASPNATPALDASKEASVDAKADVHNPRRDGGVDAVVPFEAASDAAVPTTALVRLANWSPDAPGLDFCIATHGTSSWSGPVLAAALGNVALGHVTVTDAGIPSDGGPPPSNDAGMPSDATVDAADAGSPASDAGDAGTPIGDSGSDATPVQDSGTPVKDSGSDATPAQDSGGPGTGVLFPSMSPYVSIAPGDYDLRVVAAGSTDCGTPILPEIDDLPALRAGDTQTFAAVGDTVDQGADPSLALSIFADDTVVPTSRAALRFVNAVPSVTEVTFASGTIATATAVPYLVAAQFGGAGVDTDAGALDSNDYLITAPVTDQTWSLINANGGTVTLVTIVGASIPSGVLETVVAIGGESGPNENAIGILLCADTPPIVAGETASCDLFEDASGGVCPGCH